MPTLLEVWQSRLGIAEVAGPKHNQIILDWCKAIGWESIKDDETAWCASSMNSACLEAGLPMTPHNQRPLARSFLTWGKGVDHADVQPGDVVVWPRGKSEWQGHVNCVAEVKRLKSAVKVRCIGGNQSLKGTNGAVTKTDWVDIKGALGVRRPVYATVKDLRQAGSTEVKKADRIENGGWLVTVIPAIVATAKELVAPVQVPKFESLPEQLTFWQQVLGGLNAIGDLVMAHPWLAGTAVLGILCVLVGRSLKAARVAKHEAGVPISTEVAQLGTA